MLDSEHQEPPLQGGTVVQTWIRAGTLQGHPQGPRRAGAVWGCWYSLGLLSSGRERSSLFPFQCRKEDLEISSYCQSSHSKRLGSAEPSRARACPSRPRLKGARWGRRLGTRKGLGLWVPLTPAARTGGTFQSPALLSPPGEVLPARRASPVLPPSVPSPQSPSLAQRIPLRPVWVIACVPPLSPKRGSDNPPPPSSRPGHRLGRLAVN